MSEQPLERIIAARDRIAAAMGWKMGYHSPLFILHDAMAADTKSAEAIADRLERRKVRIIVVAKDVRDRGGIHTNYVWFFGRSDATDAIGYENPREAIAAARRVAEQLGLEVVDD
jgi:nucleotide-binding universal stress UspA family protein